MSKYSNPQRSRNLYQPDANHKPFRLSRSKLELFIECPRCFYCVLPASMYRPEKSEKTANFLNFLQKKLDKFLRQEIVIF